MNYLQTLSAHKFLAMILAGISIIVLTASIIKIGPANILKQGPSLVMADQDTSTDVGNPNPGFDAGDVNTVNPNPGFDYSQPAPTVVSSGGKCYGSDAWWVNYMSDGSVQQVVDYGQQPGECGNPAAGQSPAPTSSAKTQTGTGTPYPQCGKTAGLDAYAATDTVMVTPVYWSDGSTTYQDDDKGNLGQCAQAQKTVVGTRTYGQCGNTVGLEGLDPYTQYEIVETTWSDGTKTYQNNGGRGGNPAACGQRPVAQAPVTAPVVVQSGNSQSNSCANGSNINGSNVNCSNNIGGSTTTTQTVINYGTQNQNSPITVTTPRVVYAAAQPQVVAQAPVETKELPKTGVPLVGWSLGGLLPIGIKLRKFGSIKSIISPNSIWESRELLKA